MKAFLTLFTLLIVSFSSLQAQEQIKWVTFNEALELQKKKPKKIFLDAYTTWCGPCKALDKNTFTNPDVIKFINKYFYAVKFNAEGNEEISYRGNTYTNPHYKPERKGRNATHQFTLALGVRGYPSLVYFTETGDVIQVVSGYRTPKQLEIFLKMIANDDYKKLTTNEAWAEYQKNFVSTFQE